MPKIDLMAPMRGIESGEPLTQPKAVTDESGEQRQVMEPILLRTICLSALNFPEQGVDGAEKTRRYALCMEMRDKETIDLSVEDLALIKRLISMNWNQPHIVGQAWTLLDPPGKAKEKK